ncbi:single-strand DNA-binding protein [Frankia sp. AiPs1]|uniref:single-stranded DNA-binding protein n=1 Tax=Frankia sp. AiPa1 TaxID=573492 RepID=UPI00202B8DBC|nr:single-stranded DNA-binding protein [Frankia sp. AiPa1]MCL9762926.1 single-stranded DNA-binding protein [Frankia sp. AiPa1]
MLDTTITLVGNLVDDPEHRTTTTGASVCSFRLASTPRRFDRSENRWVDGATLFLRVSCWRQLADNVASSLAKGDRALVFGHLRQRSFETNQGDKRVTFEIDADAIGPELTWHGARSQRPVRGTAPGSESEPEPELETGLETGLETEHEAEPGLEDTRAPGSGPLGGLPDQPNGQPDPTALRSTEAGGRQGARADALVSAAASGL